MALHRCPGMSPGFFRPSDVKVRKCIHCAEDMEFWKDDIKLRCPACGRINFNPDIGTTCLVWCKRADDCLGNDDIHEWIALHKHIQPPQQEQK
jgi:predicted RNA-binding Zn-ribbon protein involved in translation (DUF1610 family)